MEESCIWCPNPRAKNSRSCNPCHAAYMRKWRKTHPMTPEQKFKDNARSYAHVYLLRGKIKRKDACEKCGGNSTLQRHHEDYSKPLDVTWLCIPCHQEITNVARETIWHNQLTLRVF